jgi:hypothetical protein
MVVSGSGTIAFALVPDPLPKEYDWPKWARQVM